MHGTLAMILALSAVAPAYAASTPAERSFDRLKALVGDWRGTWSDGRAVALNYRLSAGGTVLIETWALGGGRESLTLFHLDGRTLLATHYCPQGNQPRLRLTSTAGDHFRFAFRDASNLSRGSSHQHAFDLRLDGPGRIVRRETYRTGIKDDVDTILFERVTAPR